MDWNPYIREDGVEVRAAYVKTTGRYTIRKERKALIEGSYIVDDGENIYWITPKELAKGYTCTNYL